MTAKQIIDNLEKTQSLSKTDAKTLLSSFEFENSLMKKTLTAEEQREIHELKKYLQQRAQENTLRVFGKKVFMRGLIEFTSYCKNNCYYCGLRAANKKAVRYRLTKEEILDCCKEGYALGFRTFVLQGGEDDFFTIEKMADIVCSIRTNFPQCALTLSLGEKTDEYYNALKNAGANRFLLRHETANNAHYAQLHPQIMSLDNRKRCIRTLKRLGFQTGVGIMVGSPQQSLDTIVEDLEFMQDIKPEMIGIGPFLTHVDTPFAKEKNGSLELTLLLLSILRLLFPAVLLPATTALGTLQEGGRELGLLAGANVVMPNLSPLEVRKKYLLYNNKIATGTESAEGVELLRQTIKAIGYELTGERGDFTENGAN